MSVVEDRLRGLLEAAPRSAEKLVDLLKEGLHWPIPDELTWDGIKLDYSPAELHLDPEKVAKLRKISQIRPLKTGQKFGAFVLDFDGGRLPVGAIRRLVQRLVINERRRIGGGTHAQWALDDLLFFCLSHERERLLHVVNFREKEGKRVLRVLSWSDQPTKARLDLLIRRGVPDLAWTPAGAPQIALGPEFGNGLHSYREGIRSAAALSRRMAEVAQDVRDEVRALYEVETNDGPMRRLFNDVRDQLLGDLTPARFADVYAQTMVYGLLTARIAHPEQFKAQQSTSAMRFDNEFLDAIYSRFRADSDSVIDVDELGLDELAQELAATDIEEVLADFGSENQREDTVVYFYEEFLAQYDSDQRRDLGAFYTPLPVVRYIVKTVDDVLKSFDLPLGVADSTSWAKYVQNHPGIEIPKLASPHQPVVSMFDPANGTGTFLVEWLRQAKRNAGEIGEASALEHASACEISLASYAVSHLKVSLEIAEQVREKCPRLPIYLGDTLSPEHAQILELLSDPISTEGARADEVKFKWNHNVLIGNPPYDRVESTGAGGFITAPYEGSARSLFDDIFDDAKKHVIFSAHASLYNLYVYFWRWAIWKIFEMNQGPGVVSMITASSWLDGPGFLGLRRLVREFADEIIVLDLHGDNKGARKDENVFDIESPVAIVTLVRYGLGDRTKPAIVRYASYRGTRAEKLTALSELAAGKKTLETKDASSDWHAPLIPVAGDESWASYPRLVDLFPLQQPGMMINRTWPAGPSRSLLEQRWKKFVATRVPDERARYYVTPSTGRRITTKVQGLPPLIELGKKDQPQPIVRFSIRSFDRQWIFQDPRLIALERPALWDSLSDKQVFMTTFTNTSLGSGPAATLATGVPDKHYFRGSFGGKDVIPLYRDARLTPNCDAKLLELLSNKYEAKSGRAAEVTVERLFAYCFGVLAGTDYTDRFHAALETPGPRIPLTADPDLFDRMASYGGKMIWLQTFGERFGSGKFPDAGVKWKAQPTRLPEGAADLSFGSTTETLRVADGMLTGVTVDVWHFEVSGMAVIRKWLGYRMEKPPGRAASSASPLDQIRPTTWLPEWSTELVEVVTAIKESLAMIPHGIALLEEIVSGPLIDRDELPVVPEALRRPPAVRGEKSGELELYGEDE